MWSASAHAFASSRRRPNRVGSGEKTAQKFFLDSAAESMLGVPLRDRNRPNRTIGRFGRVASERRHQSQDGASLAQRGATRTLAIPARVAMGDARCASRICRSKHAAAPVPTIDDRRRCTPSVGRVRGRNRDGRRVRRDIRHDRPRAARCWSRMRSVDSHCTLISLILGQLCRITLERPPVTRPPVSQVRAWT